MRREARPPLPGRDDVGLGRVGRADPDPDEDGHRQEERHDDAGDHAGDEQLADRGLGRDAVDHHADARRDQDVERRADPDRARRQLVGVAVAAHLRHGDARHHRRRRQARPRHGAEDAAREDGGDGQAAADAREPVGAGGVEIASEAAGGGEVGHQDEHGDRGQHVLGGDAERRRSQDPEDHGRVAAEQVDADDPRRRQREGDGDPQEQRDHHHEERQIDHRASRP